MFKKKRETQHFFDILVKTSNRAYLDKCLNDLNLS